MKCPICGGLPEIGHPSGQCHACLLARGYALECQRQDVEAAYFVLESDFSSRGARAAAKAVLASATLDNPDPYEPE